MRGQERDTNVIIISHSWIFYPNNVIKRHLRTEVVQFTVFLCVNTRHVECGSLWKQNQTEPKPNFMSLTKQYGIKTFP